MSLALVVTNPFGDYSRGAQITDAQTITDILASDFVANVVKVEAPDAPAPRSKPSSDS
jgi:hypothetical protein